MDQPQDVVMGRIGEAIEVGRAGERDRARRQFQSVWNDLGPRGDAFHRCVLAHYMADVQDDPADELTWDLRALDAAGEVTDERAKEYHHSLAIEGFYPSLHLNLAKDYFELGELDRARAHVDAARSRMDALRDDDYSNGIRAAIDRLAQRLDGADPQ